MEKNNIDQSIKGNGNNQEIVGNQTNYYLIDGVTEAKAREISLCVANEVCRQFYSLSCDMVNTRLTSFENLFIERFRNLDCGFKPLSDPSFVYSFKQAETKAAMTSDKESYEMLIELLAHREHKKDDKYSITGIHGAMEIINDISDSSLVALTVFTCIANFIRPTNPKVEDGLNDLNVLYESILTSELPTDNKWQDQLDVLKAIRVNSLTKLKGFDEILFSWFENGSYLSIGLKENSEELSKAEKILENYNDVELIENPYIKGYFVLPFVTKESISKYVEESLSQKSEEERRNSVKALESIIDSYSKEPNLLKMIKKSFVDKWSSRKYLEKVRLWWGTIEHACELTSIGRVLGHAYAQMRYKGFPPLD